MFVSISVIRSSNSVIKVRNFDNSVVIPDCNEEIIVWKDVFNSSNWIAVLEVGSSSPGCQLSSLLLSVLLAEP